MMMRVVLADLMRAYSFAALYGCKRMQPCEAGLPRRCTSVVPWMAKPLWKNTEYGIAPPYLREYQLRTSLCGR